jgi:hypothetical protein
VSGVQPRRARKAKRRTLKEKTDLRRAAWQRFKDHAKTDRERFWIELCQSAALADFRFQFYKVIMRALDAEHKQRCALDRLVARAKQLMDERKA